MLSSGLPDFQNIIESTYFLFGVIIYSVTASEIAARLLNNLSCLRTEAEIYKDRIG